MVGETLKALKNRRGWSNQQLAEAANLPADTVNKILSGSTKNPTPDTLKRLAVALGVTVDELMNADIHFDFDRVPPKNVEPMQKKAGEDFYAFYDRQITQTINSYEKRLEEAYEREKLQNQRHERRFFAMLGIIVALIALIIYLIIDALHGNWGIFQYSEIMTRVSPSNVVTAAKQFFL